MHPQNTPAINMTIYYEREDGEKVCINNAKVMSIDVESENKNSMTSFEFWKENKTYSIGLENPRVNYVFLAKILNYHNTPNIKKLINLHKKSKQRRVKKKLNNRIGREISKLFKEGYQ